MNRKKKKVTPFLLFGFKTTLTLRPRKMKNKKILNHHHSIYRTKIYDYNVTKKQKDNNKKNTGNE